MRGSGVVQSLKSLASKLHPQLPLSPKESQRLLTALTSSFRQKLDEAHPRQAHDEDTGLKVAPGSSLKAGNHALHTSSVAFADRHLTSVLTNPLLTKSGGAKKPTLNLETAKRELEQSSDRDPISLLEEYHQEGAATLSIANICLRKFRESLLSLSADDRLAKVEKHCAGKRSLQWLWESELFQTDEFVDDRKFMTVLVKMVLEEKLEHFLWAWLELDTTLGKRDKLVLPPDEHRGRLELGSRSHRYRWKNHLARILVLQRWTDQNPATLNDALDTYFRAVELHLQLIRESTTNFLPLSGVVNAINNRIIAHKFARKQWDVRRYDRYVESIDLISLGPNPDWNKHYKALLRLFHPRDPSPLPMLESLRTSSLAKRESSEGSIWNSFGKDTARSDTRTGAKSKRYKLLAETARQLRHLDYKLDSDWLVSHIRDLYPEFAHCVEDDLSTGDQSQKKRPVTEDDSTRSALASFTKFEPV